MKKKCLFLVPPSLLLNDHKHGDVNSVWNKIPPPYGPLSIISYVNIHANDKIDFKIVDLRPLYYAQDNEKTAAELALQEVKKSIKEYRPDFICISALFNTCYFHMDNLMRALEKTQTKAIISVGGGFATVSYQDILDEFKRVDVVFTAEGEVPVLNFLTSKDPLHEYKKNSAIITRESLKNGYLPKPQFIQDLDEIPVPDFSYIDTNLYDKQMANLMTSRGCPYNCVFCAAYLMTGKKIRYYSAKRVNQDIQEYYDKGFRHFNIFDDNFFFNHQRALNILEKLIKLNKNNDISINFPSGVMVAHITEEIADLLGQLNIEELSLALESGSEKVLKEIIKKPVTKKDFERAVEALRKNNIKVRTFIVTGLPGETNEDRKDTVEYLKKVGVDWASINIAIPLIGSRLYKICKENNYLKNFEKKKFRMGSAYIETPDFSAEEIKEQVYRMNLDVNFINNYNLRMGNYESMVPVFRHMAEAYKNHAFAYYCLFKCYKGLNDNKNAQENLNKFMDIINKDKIWHNRAKKFNLIKESVSL